MVEHVGNSVETNMQIWIGIAWLDKCNKTNMQVDKNAHAQTKCRKHGLQVVRECGGDAIVVC